MSEKTVIVETDSRGVATVTLNRPAVHNAFDDAMIARLDEVFTGLVADGARLMVLRAAGRSFCAGADAGWMKASAQYSEAENIADACRLSAMLARLNGLPMPTLALVQGAAFGGGLGLVACCDIALAAGRARFCLSEVRLGLTPATISPYVVAAMGARAARRYFLSAERFTADEARRLGLVHEVVGDEAALADAGAAMVSELLAGAPGAQAAAKELIFTVAGHPLDEALREDTARRIATRRASAEGREGLGAFLEKRKPKWTGDV